MDQSHHDRQHNYYIFFQLICKLDTTLHAIPLLQLGSWVSKSRNNPIYWNCPYSYFEQKKTL